MDQVIWSVIDDFMLENCSVLRRTMSTWSVVILNGAATSLRFVVVQSSIVHCFSDILLVNSYSICTGSVD